MRYELPFNLSTCHDKIMMYWLWILFTTPCIAGFLCNEDQVCDYVHYSEPQRRTTWHLLSKVKFNGDENILDLGCGDGRNAAWMALLVRQGQVTAVDTSPPMISWAKKQYHPQEFPNLTFLHIDEHQFPDGSFDVITSFFNLNHEEDKQETIQNIYEALNDEGYAVVLVTSGIKNKEFADAVRETTREARWKPFFKDAKLPFHIETLENYIEYFKTAGFSIVCAEDVSSMDPFVNRNEMVQWLKGTWPHVFAISTELRMLYINTIIDRYIQKRPSAYSKDGVLYFYGGHYEIIAQKNSSN